MAAALVAVEEEESGELERVLRRRGYGRLSEAGTGSFGRVYRVRENAGGRELACKVAEGMEARAILRREAALLKALDHPLFARYEDYAEGERIAMLFMEYAEGRDLDAVLRRGPLSGRRARAVAVRIAEGLLYLHELPDPVLYRDLKPGNVRVDRRGGVKLLDLGCACRLSEAEGSRAGSRGFAAPEQLDAAGGDTQTPCPQGFYSDVYAWGRLLEHMTVGLDRSPAWESLIRACTERDPSLRPQSMREALERFKNFE
ncbi:MAG: serine/threonine protein kinase [Acetatifactor muris]|nr:serine/threonine protein kinase [Acetatifactor muris]MCM1527736.1 serine/threonine protein kinase [Bacteroides sp.]